MRFKRSRLIYIALTVLTIGLGLLSRSNRIALPEFLAAYSGDALWAMMVFWIFCAIRPDWKPLTIGAMALAFAFAIEFSQLYHAPWIDSIRSTRLGGLVLGFGFKASDLVCYFAGVLAGFTLDMTVLRRLIHKGV